MPTYTYRCAGCGRFDVHRPMAERADHEPCPSCGAMATRVFAAPFVRQLDTRLRAAMDASAQSADAPRVVTTVPGTSRRRQRRTTDPRHARLPSL